MMPRRLPSHVAIACCSVVSFVVAAACSSPGGGSSGWNTHASPFDGGSQASGDDSSAGDDAGTSGGDSGGTTSHCKYPSAPYGIHQDQTIAQSLSWQCVMSEGGAIKTFQLSDWYDCDGTKGTNAILVDVSAVWCGNCQREAQDFEPVMQSKWKAEGVKVVTMMWQDASRQPATIATAQQWSQTYGLTDVVVCVDPTCSFADPNSTVGLPRNLLVDPRTMKIVAVGDGYGSGPDPVVDQLAKSNGG